MYINADQSQKNAAEIATPMLLSINRAVALLWRRALLGGSLFAAGSPSFTRWAARHAIDFACPNADQ